MNSFTQLIDNLLRLLVQFGNLIVAAIVAVELWLRGQLSELGVAPHVQTVILLVLAVVLILSAFRLFGGLVRVAVVLVLVLIASHIILPLVPH